MELVYLWVADYKNIKSQGFNFSPRFRCEYDEDTKELTINENKDYVSIFPDNINVTAIVGENGSGKSSLLISLLARERGFIVVNENNQLKIYNKNVIINTQLQQLRLTSKFNKNILYYAMDSDYLLANKRHNQWIHIEQTVQLYVENYLRIRELSFNIYNFEPEFLFYTIVDNDIIPSQDELIDGLMESIIIQTETDSDTIYKIIQELRKIDDEYFLYLFYFFENISILIDTFSLSEKIHPKDGYLIFSKHDVIKFLSENNLPFLPEDDFQIVKDNQNRKIPIEKLEEKFGDNYIELLFDRDKIILEFNLFANNEATFSSLSHGEKTIYGILLHIVLFPLDNFLLFMDEPDNTLHPEWQKKFLHEMIKLLNAHNKEAHIAITSHSPFILSDLPKENVIFLENGKQFDPGIETFGANIHTLLSHGFFMKDGLMGEFAKEKINKTITLLNQPKRLSRQYIKYCENIISVIGEPILKKQLQKMLDSKRLHKMDEIDRLKADISVLHQKLKKLEGRK